MLPLLRISLIVSVIFMLLACSTAQLEDYASNQPRLDLPKFFNGTLSAHGLVKNRSGKVTRYFTAEIIASWKDGTGTLEEKFQFDDGEIQYRTWTLVPSAGGYTATAGDVIGPGKAQTRGNAMQMDYQLQVNYKGSPLVISVEDWMWLVDDNTILNESILRKWGFKVGSVQLVIQKNPPNSSITRLQSTSR